MLEIPLFQELSEEFLAKGITLGVRQSLITLLKARFDDFTPQLEREIEAVPSHERLEDLIRVASTCRNLAEFERIFRA